jgi:hypothetical protein
MQVQQIAEEEFLLSLSENELTSIVGGAPPPMPIPFPPRRVLSNQELDPIERQLIAGSRRPNPLNIARFGRKIASTEFI